MKRIFVVLLVVLLLHISSLLFVASVEQSIYCDPIPQDLIDMVDGVSQDCIAFDAPDGSAYQYTTFSPANLPRIWT